MLFALAVGPSRCRAIAGRIWSQIWRRKQEPEEVIEQVVQQYRTMVDSLNQTLERAHTADATLERNIEQSGANLARLDGEAREAARRGDDLVAKGVLFKSNLEREALAAFNDQRARHARQIDEIRRNLYAAELQLRQYEVGRELLLAQLAEAKTVEQQYRIASEFDPFSAVGNWKQAENMVEEKQISARAIGRPSCEMAASHHCGAPPRSTIMSRMWQPSTHRSSPPPRASSLPRPRSSSTFPTRPSSIRSRAAA